MGLLSPPPPFPGMKFVFREENPAAGIPVSREMIAGGAFFLAHLSRKKKLRRKSRICLFVGLF